MLKSLTIKQKNYLLIAMVSAVMTITVYMAFAITVEAVYHERQFMAKNMTQTAHNIIQGQYELFQEGKLSESEAQTGAKEIIRHMRYENKGYFFIFDNAGMTLLHPFKPNLEGTNQIGMMDPNGLPIVKNLSTAAQQPGGGFVSYKWYNPETGKNVPKVSYALGFEPWNWFIGTGAYQADISSQVSGLIERKSIFIVAAALIFSLSIATIILIGRDTLKQVVGVRDHLEDFAEGNFSKRIPSEGNDEFSAMFASMRQVQSQMDATLNELGNSIDAANQGDLTTRVSIGNKKGYYKHLGTSINELIEGNHEFISDTSRVFSALSQGDLNKNMEKRYEGAFGQLQQDANNTLNKLDSVINHEIQSLVAAASKGDLSQRINLSDKTGFFLTLSENINSLIDSVENLHSDLASSLGEMANGNLTQPITNHYQGSFDQLKRDTNATIETVNKVVIDLLDSASFLTKGADEISMGNTNLAQRTETQAHALIETASSMEEINTTVRNNANNALQAKELADTARQSAEQGGAVVQRAITAMSEINQSSEEISDIINVINEIAFQTNLLALNAAVEAARAGEQGRGFAVVANEVRNLAGRSATAAKEIKELIENSVGKVETGSLMVNETGDTLEEILQRIAGVVDIVSQIAQAENEQSDGISRVNNSIANLDEMTQQNAALAQESSVAATSMRESSVEMQNLMGFFKVSSRKPNKTNYEPSREVEFI